MEYTVEELDHTAKIGGEVCAVLRHLFVERHSLW
jgi:hypothetical protein